MSYSTAWKKPQFLVLFGALVNTEHERFIGGNAKISETESCYSYLRQTEFSVERFLQLGQLTFGAGELCCGPILCTVVRPVNRGPVPCTVGRPVHRGPSRAPWARPVHRGPSRAPWAHPMHYGSILCTMGPSRAPWARPVHYGSILCTVGPSCAPWARPVHCGPSYALWLHPVHRGPVPCTVACLVHCGMFSSKPGLCPLDARRPLSSCNNQQCLQTLLSVSSGTNSPWVRIGHGFLAGLILGPGKGSYSRARAAVLN